MKKRVHGICSIVLPLLVICVCAGCGEETPRTYGTAINAPEVTSIKAVLSDPEAYAQKTVAIEGKITAVCPSGCWFDMVDQNVEIHVDIKPSGFVVPQLTGETVRVEGNARVKEGGGVEFIGKGVQVR